MRTSIIAAALAFAGWMNVPTEPDAETTMHLGLVRAASIGTPLSLTDPGVVEVSEVLGAALPSHRGMSPEEVVDEMERVLIEAYGAAKVSMQESETTYELVYDSASDSWYYVCFPSGEFSIDDGGNSPVLATVSFEIPYELSDI